MTEVANPNLGKIEDVIEKFGMFALLSVGLNALFAAVPLLGNWFFGPIIRKLTDLIGNKIFEILRLQLDLKVIKFVNQENQAAFDREVLKLKLVARDHGIDSEEFKKERQDAHTTFSNFVRFHGA